MAVGFILDFANMGQDKYEAVMKEIGLDQKGAKWPEGIISHVAGKTANGWSVVDVWDSEQAFGRFKETRLGPAFGKVGGVPEPRVTTFTVFHRHPSAQYPSG